MILFYIGIILLCINRLRFTAGYFNSPTEGFMSKPSTNAIKGICILFVFARHVNQYLLTEITELSYANQLFLSADTRIRQLLVVMFLFYSGYGVSESIKKKGDSYIKSIPTKRILVTMLNFSIAVCIFIALGVILGRKLSLAQCLLSLIGWESVGNSNWYIFCIVIMYGATYIVCRLVRYDIIRLGGIVLISILYIIVIQKFRGGYWVDTAMAYPLGFAFSSYKGRIDYEIQRRYPCWLLLLASGFLLSYVCPLWLYGIPANICAMFFAMTVVVLTMKIQFRNSVLCWCGKNLFPCYIYQRLPMLALAAIGDGHLIAHYEAAYVIACLITTFAIMALYKHIQIKPEYLIRNHSAIISQEAQN